MSNDVIKQAFDNNVNKISCIPETIETIEVYDSRLDEKEIIKPLKPLFQHKYKKLNIWITAGMNPGLNLLLLLAYLDQIQDHNMITIYLYDEKMRNIKNYTISAEGYYAIYQTVLLKHQKPREITISPIQQAITYFLEYIKESNSMKQFIQDNLSLEPQMLYIKFNAYHLTDQQFIQLLHEVKKEIQ